MTADQAGPDEPAEEETTWGLVFPFIVCQSQGGPYDDDSFVAGYAAGRIDTALAAAATVGADRAQFTVRTDLVPQIQLIAIHHGFTRIAIEQNDFFHDWTLVTLIAPREVG